MNGMSRYVFRQLLVGLILVTVPLTCVIWLTQSLRFVEMIVNRGLSAVTLLRLTALSLPYLISIILPIALFTVVVFIYNKMITDRELVIMRVAGLSQLALAKPALILGLLVTLLLYAMNLWILPASYAKFRDLQWEIRNYSHVLLQEGAFNAVASNITVYVRQRKSDGQLRGILVHDKRNREKPATAMAEQGALVATESGSRVVMFNGNRQQLDRKTNQMSILYFDRYVFDMSQGGPLPEARNRGRRERTVGELLDIENDPTVLKSELSIMKMEAHRRIATPLAPIGYTLVALACIISGGFTRRNQPRRIVIAVLMFIALQACALGVENLTTKDPRWFWLIYLTAVVPILAAAWFLARPRRWIAPRSRPLAGAEGH